MAVDTPVPGQREEQQEEIEPLAEEEHRKVSSSGAWSPGRGRDGIALHRRLRTAQAPPPKAQPRPVEEEAHLGGKAGTTTSPEAIRKAKSKALELNRQAEEREAQRRAKRKADTKALRAQRKNLVAKAEEDQRASEELKRHAQAKAAVAERQAERQAAERNRRLSPKNV